MEYYAGLDVPMEETDICVLNREGVLIREGKPLRFAQINGDKAGRRNRWRHHLRNLQSFDCAPILSAQRDLLHGNFYEADSDFRYGAEAPDNLACTMRVLTIMMARDW